MEKVFVSSTCFDLIDLRAELEQELKSLGLNPIMSDRISSDFAVFFDKNSIETCLINLRQSNVVIVILSQRYGPSLGKVGFEDISATHLEYREAIKCGIPTYFYVRDRLEAEYNLYENNQDPSLLKWIKPTEVKVFDFFREHKKLINHDRSNWYYSFRDVVDLKERLKKDLKKHSAESALKRITDSGQAPCIIIHSFKGKIVENSNNFFFVLIAKNVGNSVAIEPFLTYYRASEYKVKMDMADEVIGELKTLLPTEEGQVPFELQLTTDQLSTGNLDLIFEISYTTITGHYLGDVIMARVEFDFRTRMITELYTKYDTKRYYHSEAIRRLTNDSGSPE